MKINRIHTDVWLYLPDLSWASGSEIFLCWFICVVETVLPCQAPAFAINLFPRVFREDLRGVLSGGPGCSWVPERLQLVVPAHR